MSDRPSQTGLASDDGPVASNEAVRVENPFSCNICKRSYTRVDHLSRHYRSHTREKPFVCDICSKDFARVDLLKRHVAAHSGERPSKRQKTPRKTAHSRVSQACIACAEVKLRCEGTEPCGRCRSKDLVCEYSRPRSEKTTAQSEPRQDSETLSTSVHEMPPEPDVRSVQQPEHNTHNDLAMEHHQGQSGRHLWHQDVLDQPQLPTPTTFDHNSSILPLDEMSYAVDPGMTFDDLPLLDFLKEVMASPQTHNDMRQALPDGMQQHYQRDLLDFNIDTYDNYPYNYSLPGLDPLEQQPMPFQLLRGGEDPSGMGSGMTTPGMRGSIGIGNKAFKESIWLWTPAQEDHGYMEQSNLSLPHGGVVSPSDAVTSSYPREHLMQAARDRLLASVLGTCESANVSRVVACFPSAELLTSLLHNFLEFHLIQDMCWIHPSTLKINEEIPEFLGCLICSGAAISPVPELRKLGFALQEAMRLSIPALFESDNRNTRRLRVLQSYALQLDVGLWSGDRRKMEIAQSFGLPLVTMMRRAGHFRRSKYSDRAVQHEDDKKTTESKWHAWVEAESFKRLALYLFSKDSRSSMSLLDQPLISYAEISTDLPYSRDLWLATTAQEWKSIYLARCPDIRNHLPSIRTCIDDASPIFKYSHVTDVDMALILMICSIWSLIWQYREMKMISKSVTKGGLRTDGPTANSLKQEISQLMQHLSLNATEWSEGMKPGPKLMYEQSLMHLHVSLYDVQLLAGKEGEDEARKAFPVLTAWAESSESRLAIFHAGQLFKAAKQYKTHMLRDASAVAVYHASLAFWAYSVASKNPGGSEDSMNQHTSRVSTSHVGEPRFVRLDGEDSPELQRFLVLGKGIPSIRRMVAADDSNVQPDIPLSDLMNVMNAMTSLLWNNNGADEKSCPPMVVNLSKLMRSLGNIAAGMRR